MRLTGKFSKLRSESCLLICSDNLSDRCAASRTVERENSLADFMRLIPRWRVRHTRCNQPAIILSTSFLLPRNGSDRQSSEAVLNGYGSERSADVDLPDKLSASHLQECFLRVQRQLPSFMLEQ